MNGPPIMPIDLDRDMRVSLLAVSDPDALIPLADACLDEADVELRHGPAVGTVLLQVREPIERRRFYLGDVLATEARVRLAGHDGWAMRMGDDAEATLAAAICDASVEAELSCRGDILDLCQRTHEQAMAQRAAELRDIAATAVEFEELGG